MTDDELVRRARRLVRTGPLDEAKTTVAQLLDSPLSGPQHAEVHYLAGRLARDEGRWKAAETYLRTAQLFPVEDVSTARHIEHRANDMAATAGAREPEQALRELHVLRAGRPYASIPTSRLVDMVQVASGAELSGEVDGILAALRARAGTPAAILFEAAMAAAGTGSEDLVIALLEQVAKRPNARYRPAALYHLGRAHERAGQGAEAALFFTQAKSTATLSRDTYYQLWADNGLQRVQNNRHSSQQEGLSNSEDQTSPSPPRVSDRALAERLRPIAELHQDSYPWIARAATLLLVGERDAATAELFETYLTWRDALGRPDCEGRPRMRGPRRWREHEPIDERTSLRTPRALGRRPDDACRGRRDARRHGDRGWFRWGRTSSRPCLGHTNGSSSRPREAWTRSQSSCSQSCGSRAPIRSTSCRTRARSASCRSCRARDRLIAHALGHDDFTPADLLDPTLNLEFAAWYLSSLIQRFDGRLPLAIAAYNGGPHNVRRWIQESAEETPLDVLLERIPFTQTHRYVRKVLVHYEAYRQQRELPMPQLSVQLPAQRVDPLAF